MPSFVRASLKLDDLEVRRLPGRIRAAGGAEKQEEWGQNKP